MKTKILLTLLFAVLVQFCFGQEYHKLVDTNKIWSTIILQEGNPIYSYFTIFSEDTIIGGENYKRIFKSTDSSIWTHIGFVREDSLKRIYFRDTLNSEGLVYDFDVNIGDTINFNNPLIPYLIFSGTYVIDSVYTINFSGIMRKAIDIIVSSDIYGYSRETWIEGIGNLLGILEGGRLLSPTTGWDYRLLCFYENGTLLYQNPLYPYCYYPTNTNDYWDNKTKKGFIIYPNPAYNKIYVECDTKLENIYLEIYNIWGQIEKKLKINNEVIYLDESLKDGLYFCILKDESDNILAKTKLIINKTY